MLAGIACKYGVDLHNHGSPYVNPQPHEVVGFALYPSESLVKCMYFITLLLLQGITNDAPIIL